MTNPIHYNATYDEYYVWMSRLGVKYMKYFPTAESALEFVRRNPRVCMELDKTDRVLEVWASEASAAVKAPSEVLAEESDAATATTAWPVGESERPRKGRFASALDVIAFSLPITLLAEIGIGGLIPVVIVGGICAYLSSKITGRISRSRATGLMRVASYITVLISYFSAFVVALFAIHSLR